MVRHRHDGAPSQRRGSLSFGVVSSHPETRERLHLLCEDLTRKTSVVVYPNVAASYAKLASELLARRVDVAWAPPSVALDLEEQGAAVVIACCERERGTNYHSAIFTRSGGPARSLNDLRGLHMAWVDRESTSGYIVPRLFIAASGADPDALLGRETFFGTHDAVVDAVLRGVADVGATHAALDPATGAVLDAGWIPRLRAEPAAVHVIATAGPIPTDTVVVGAHVAPGTREAITAALVDASGPALTAIRALFAASRLKRAAVSHLAPVARLRSRLRASIRPPSA